ncbi:MAG: hypothetical protein A2X11_12440 [Bacteroidetes bacterium GWE2_42_24]|nr:MAG: hypothetical protein A2X11_12440 [Bacteroidetes bacterium GWE2_42_24]OFY30586.1 MAG: hypothetical protein A2X09_03685 [Bacteroidetes bacterium GWF2_43_11]PKP18618.1 MAG: hypothetical protein CVU06_12035 [Bacteroidetes bacterium HGW-Bacteroidetes-22]
MDEKKFVVKLLLIGQYNPPYGFKSRQIKHDFCHLGSVFARGACSSGDWPAGYRRPLVEGWGIQIAGASGFFFLLRITRCEED